MPSTSTSTATGIYNLANELLDKIVQQVYADETGVEKSRIRNLCSLRLTWRRFRVVVDCYLFSEIQFNFTHIQGRDAVNASAILFEHKATAIGHYAKELDINACSTAPSRYNSLMFAKDINDFAPLAKYHQQLSSAIASLKNVTAVHWYVGNGPAEFNQGVFLALAQLPNLKEFTFKFFRQQLRPGELRLQALKGLHCLSLEIGCDDDVVSQLRTLISNSPELKRLEFTSVTDQDNFGNRFRLQCLSRTLLRTSFWQHRPPLQHLKLHSNTFTLKVDGSILPNLRSIDLSVPNAAEVWKAFQSKARWLREIHLDRVSPPMLDYLESNPALEVLSIAQSWDLIKLANGLPDLPALTRLADRFYDSTLPRLSPKLENLSLHFVDNVSCVTIIRATSILQCQELQSLQVTVDVDTIVTDEGLLPAIVPMLCGLPKLHSLKILLSHTKIRFGCGTGAMRYRRMVSSTWTKIVLSLKFEDPVPGRKELDIHLVEAQGSRFSSQRDVDGMISFV